MDNFIVSARKYRPATFDTVVGQNHITSTLKNAIKNKQLAQAFLFTGPRGVGKTTCARIFAKTINCMNLNDNIEPCNICESCVSFNRSASFNIHELDAASNSSVDDIRNLVDQVRIPPQVGRYKVYIIDEVHMLSSSAFNAFLKTLEEPPDYAKFILATTEKHKIIPTILSRCQIYDFKRINVGDITQHLMYVAGREGIKADPDALHIIALKADGALRDALSIFDQLVSFAGKELNYDIVRENLNVLDYDYYFRITDSLLAGDIFNSLLILDKIIESGFDGQHFLSGLGSHFRDLLVSHDPGTIKLLEVGEKIHERYLNQTNKCPVDFLLKALDIVQKTDYTYKVSNNKRLHLEVALLQMAAISKPAAGQVQKVSANPEAEKKKTDFAPAVVQKVPEKADIAPPKIVTPVPVEPKPEPKKVTQPNSVNKGFFPGTISIKDDIIENEEEAPVKEEPFDLESEEFQNAPEINIVELEEAWKEFAMNNTSDRPNFFSTLMASKPSTGNAFIISFEVKNIIQQQEIEDNKGELLRFLREKLNNRFLRLNVVVNAEVSTARPYSPEEIHKYMQEKNPAVIVLKEKLGLSLNY